VIWEVMRRAVANLAISNNIVTSVKLEAAALTEDLELNDTITSIPGLLTTEDTGLSP